MAVSLILNSGRTGNREDASHHDKQVNHIINALQYIIDWNIDDISSSNRESDSASVDDRVLQRTQNNSDVISRIKNEIREVITKDINKENDSDASNSQLSSDNKILKKRYKDIEMVINMHRLAFNEDN